MGKYLIHFKQNEFITYQVNASNMTEALKNKSEWELLSDTEQDDSATMYKIELIDEAK